MQHPLIGLYSPVPQSGKTTVARILERHGYRRLSFADTLKEMAQVLYRAAGISPERIALFFTTGKEVTVPELGVTTRHLLQTLGTEWGRHCIGQNLWVNLALARARAANAPVVFDDMRFPNEHQALYAAGGTMAKVIRAEVLLTQDRPTHASEGALCGAFFDYTVHNNGTLEALKANVLRHLVRPSGTAPATPTRSHPHDSPDFQHWLEQVHAAADQLQLVIRGHETVRPEVVKAATSLIAHAVSALDERKKQAPGGAAVMRVRMQP